MKINKTLLLVGATLALPVLSMAADADAQFGAETSIKDVVTNFFGLPIIKGVAMAGTIGGGLYLVLEGFGIIGKEDKTSFKKIIFGGILVGIGLSYNTLTALIASQFA